MTKQEFEARVKKSVSDKEFDFANEVYMNSGDMDKDAFCAEFPKVSNTQIVAELNESVKSKDEYIKQLKAQIAEQAEAQEKKMKLFIDKLIAMTDRDVTITQVGLADEIIELVGAKHYLKRKAEMNCTYLDIDYKHISEVLSDNE